MTWRDELRPASFRGVPFEATQTGGTFGRRLVEHEYPQRDVPGVEDLGRAIRPITLTAFVIGAEYRASRDALLDALEAPGPGTLVHPWLGTLRVYARPGSYSESSAEGGMARFELSFIEAGSASFPSVVPDTKAAAVAAADVAIEAVGAAAASELQVSGVAEWLPSRAARTLTRQIASVRQTITGPGAGVVAEVAAVTRALDSIDTSSPIDELLGQLDAALRLVGSVRPLRLLTTEAGAAPPALSGTVADQVAAMNDWVIERAVVRAALAATVALASSEAWDTHDEAIALRDETAARISAEAELEQDATAYAALVDLRAALIDDLTARAAPLARLRTITPPTVTSTLELAQLLYADPARAEEIAARNRISHPGFVSRSVLVVS